MLNKIINNTPACIYPYISHIFYGPFWPDAIRYYWRSGVWIRRPLNTVFTCIRSRQSFGHSTQRSRSLKIWISRSFRSYRGALGKWSMGGFDGWPFGADKDFHSQALIIIIIITIKSISEEFLECMHLWDTVNVNIKTWRMHRGGEINSQLCENGSNLSIVSVLSIHFLIVFIYVFIRKTHPKDN